MKPLKLALLLFGIAFLLSMWSIGWTLSNPYLYDIFWKLNTISLVSALLCLMSFIVGIGWGILIYKIKKSKP